MSCVYWLPKSRTRTVSGIVNGSRGSCGGSEAPVQLAGLVVRRLAGDGDVVRVVLAERGARDLDEPRAGLELGDVARADVAHPGAEPAHELVHEPGELPAVRH